MRASNEAERVDFAGFMDGHDMRMIQHGRGACFQQETARARLQGDLEPGKLSRPGD